MYATISCANDRASGGIKISAVWDGQPDYTLTRVQLRRCFTGETDYEVVYENDVTLVSQLSFSVTDIKTIAGVSYTYTYCTLTEDSLWIENDSAEIVCHFEGVVLSDEYGTWHSAFGTSENRFALNAQKNKPVNYIITLSGKYPHRVSNAQTNYWTGNCTAIWLPYQTTTYNGETCVEPTVENADAYRLAFMEWLVSDTEKYMKTHDGKAMIVSIDGNPQENYNAMEGLTAVSFDWTQIGEVDMPGVSS